MQRKKLTKKDKILLAVLAALIVVVIVAGAVVIINNVNSANEFAESVSQGSPTTDSSGTETAEYATQSETEKGASDSGSQSVSGQSEVSSSGKSGSLTSSGSPAGSDSQTKSDSSKKTSSESRFAASGKTSGSSGKSSSASSKSSSTTSSKTSSGTTSGDKVDIVTAQTNATHASNKELKVNGKSCYVGDTITVTLNLTSDKSLINYQGETSYDSKYLKLNSVKSNNLGLANSNGTAVMYNASTLNGMDFSKTGTVYTATFEVIESGSTKINNNLEIISELKDNTIRQLASSEYSESLEIYN